MSQRKVCRLHGHTVMQCRCPCPDREIPMDCNDWCPDYGKPPQDETDEHPDGLRQGVEAILAHFDNEENNV